MLQHGPKLTLRGWGGALVSSPALLPDDPGKILVPSPRSNPRDAPQKISIPPPPRLIQRKSAALATPRPGQEGEEGPVHFGAICLQRTQLPVAAASERFSGSNPDFAFPPVPSPESERQPFP